MVGKEPLLVEGFARGPEEEAGALCTWAVRSPGPWGGVSEGGVFFR